MGLQGTGQGDGAQDEGDDDTEEQAGGGFARRGAPGTSAEAPAMARPRPMPTSSEELIQAPSMREAMASLTPSARALRSIRGVESGERRDGVADDCLGAQQPHGPYTWQARRA